MDKKAIEQLAEDIYDHYPDFGNGERALMEKSDVLAALCEMFEAGAAAASPQTGWVKISEQLPEHKQRVLAFGEYGGKPTIKTALFHAGQKYTTEQWYWSGWEEFKITHWISLPEPPIEAAFQGSASDQNTNQ
jgi:hypothetical protein